MGFADLQLHDTLFDSNQDGMGAIAHPQLAKDIVHGALADVAAIFRPPTRPRALAAIESGR